MKSKVALGWSLLSSRVPRTITKSSSVALAPVLATGYVGLDLFVLLRTSATSGAVLRPRPMAMAPVFPFSPIDVAHLLIIIQILFKFAI